MDAKYIVRRWAAVLKKFIFLTNKDGEMQCTEDYKEAIVFNNVGSAMDTAAKLNEKLRDDPCKFEMVRIG